MMIRKRSSIASRASQDGNILAMVALMGAIIIVVMLIGITAVLLFMSQSKGQGKSDEIAVSLAKILNDNDRQGRMNVMVERSRELVYTSREVYGEISSRYRHLEPLARQLMEESRSGAQLVDAGRRTLADVTVRELAQHSKQRQDILGAANVLNLSWFRAAQPEISFVEVGSLKNVDSNVYAPDKLPELKEYDLSNNFVNPKSGLYLGAINAKLPAPDDDLNFKFSSLPAPVKGTIAAARLASPEMFEKAADSVIDGQAVNGSVDQIPSAIRLKLVSAVAAKSQKELKGQIGTVSTAATNGGAPPPDEVSKTNDGKGTP